MNQSNAAMPAANKGQTVEEILMVSVTLNVCGQALVDDLVATLTQLPGVDAVLEGDGDVSMSLATSLNSC